MIDRSPMIDRLHGSHDDSIIRRIRKNVPRKRVLRILLVFLMLFAGIKIAESLTDSTAAPGPGAPGDSTQLRKTEPQKKGPVRFAVKMGNSLAYNEVVAFLSMAPPALNNGVDTVYVGNDTVYRYFTIDTTLQKQAATLFGQYRPQYGIAAILHPHSGRVLALVSYTHDSARVLGDHLYLRSFLPAASLFKTVVAAAAIEKAGYVDSTAIPVKGRNHTLYKSQLRRHIEPWKEVEFGEAFARSINPVFARIGMYALGRTVLDDYCTRFGFNDRIPFEMAVDTSRVTVPPDTVYAMAECASGFNRKTTLSALHGALISTAILTNGAIPRPRLVDRIIRSDGRCLYRSETQHWKTAVTGATAAQLATIMARVIERGTARRSFRTFKRNKWSVEVEVGGKTGSLNVDTLGKIDWFTGYAASRNDGETSLAIAVAMVHGTIWTVHSAYIAAEIVTSYFRPRRTGLSTRDLTIPVTIDSVDTDKTPEG
ncbi:MAG: hypothetical protein JW768_12015 [Chitinispirillaceae bacterium]|nr:hypothetical protein [Chitinispirillaceae bacterium]